MARKCPKCGSLDVRRTSTRSDGTHARPGFRSPYRCRSCSEQFWVISRRTYQAAGIAATVQEEILAAVKEVKAQGLRTVVLQSGEDPWFTKDRLSDMILRVKGETGLTITLSVGERLEAEYRAWKESGADRYLLKQETSSAELFAKLRLFESFLLRGGSIHEAGSSHEERVEASFHFCHSASVRLDGQVGAAIQPAHPRSILPGAPAGRPA